MIVLFFIKTSFSDQVFDSKKVRYNMVFYEPFIVSMYNVYGYEYGYQNVLENIIKHSMYHFSTKTIFFPCSFTRFICIYFSEVFFDNLSNN